MADARRAGRPGALTEPARVVGWRYWHLDLARSRLRSVSHRQVEWRPGHALRAACIAGRHQAPAPGCNCGIYAAPDVARLRARGLCLAPDLLIAGRVALWGRVLADDESHRGEYAYPVALAIVRETVTAELEPVVAALGHYGVPVEVVRAEDVLGPLSAAQLAFQAMARQTTPEGR